MQKTDVIAKKKSRLEKRRIKRTYLLLCFGVVLVFSGYSAMLMLQSSLNIVGGLGSKITAVSYGFSIFFSLFAVPICIRLLGPKKSLITSEAAYVFYVLLNMYPKEWSLMIAAVVVAWAEATFWVALGLLFIYYGQKYQKYSKKSVETCVREFSGTLFGLHILNQVFGNIFGFIILHFFKFPMGDAPPNNLPANMTTMSVAGATTSVEMTTVMVPFTHEITVKSYGHCGANDCQDAATTLDNIEQYVPSTFIAVYVMLATFAVIMISGMMIHICFFPEFSLHENSKTKKIDENLDVEDILHSHENSRNNDKNTDCDETVTKPNLNICTDTAIALKDILKQAKDWRQILMYPANLYNGFIIGFLYSEATRAYASCVKGVSQVGICAIIAALNSSIGNFVGSRVMGKYGMRPVLCFAVLLDLLMYVLCLLWIPTNETSWIVHLIFVWLGLDQALWNLLVTNFYAESFADKHELCFTMWCCWFSAGFAIQYGWSTALCVREKIYIQIPILILGAVCLFVLRYKLKQRKNTNDMKLGPI